MNQRFKWRCMVMKKKKINVAVISAGNRAQGVVGNLLRDSENNVNVVSLYDPDPAEMEHFCSKLNLKETKCCSSAEEAIHLPGVEWVMVFSPNAYHKKYILAGFAAGKHVFSEKPLATTVEDCREVYQAHLKSGKLFATGFVLRYSPIYRKAKEILDSGRLGRIMTIEANENIPPAHGGYIICNWRRHSAIAGPHILEKCCHDLDLINWFCGSLPSQVASFGKREFFVKENQYIGDKYGEDRFLTWRDPHRNTTPFAGDNDLQDNQICIARFRNNILVSFCATMCNIIPERRMLFHCTEGNLILELYSSSIKYRNLADEKETEIKFSADGHGGGDNTIMKELYECMCEGSTPKCSGSEGLESAVFALALDQASQTGQIVDLEPVWKSLGR